MLKASCKVRERFGGATVGHGGERFYFRVQFSAVALSSRNANYTPMPILAGPILGLVLLYALSWLGPEGVYIGPRMGLARIGIGV